jgi:hypothetical protein
MQRITTDVEGRREVGIDADRLIDQLYSQFIAPYLTGNDPQQVQSVRMVRLGFQHAPITSLGLGQSCCVVVFDARPE